MTDINWDDVTKAISKFVLSDDFQSMTPKQKKAWTKHAFPLIVSAFASIQILEYMKGQLDLDKLNHDIEITKLEKMWNKET